MVSIRFTCLLVGLFFSLVLFRSSINPLAQQATILELKARKYQVSIDYQGFMDDAVSHSMEFLRGRKMLVHHYMGMKRRVKVKGLKAKPSVSNCDDGDEGKRDLNVEGELGGHGGLPSKASDDVFDFIPFSADYSKANPHPPKHN